MVASQKSRKRNSKKVATSTSKLRLLRLAEHRHTAKLVHRRHTSHLALLVLLAMIGPFVFMFQNVSQAVPPAVSGDVYVTATVDGPAPAVGATITSPSDGAEVPYQPTIEVRGTCAANTVVIVSSNDSIIGSTACTSAGIFALNAQLQVGKNVLSAKNYDTLNQAGPDTPSVTVMITSTQTADIPKEVYTPIVLPTNPYITNNQTDCSHYTVPLLPSDSRPRVAVVCMPRSVAANAKYTIGLLVWGGVAPYALNIDWGNDSKENELLSVTQPGYVKVSFASASPGVHDITIRLKDANQTAAYVEAAIQTNGEKQSFFGGIKDSIANTKWFETPVPFYFLAIALTLGFWGGDLFDRYFGVTKHYRGRKA